MREKHGWNTWENYLQVHERVLRDYSKHFQTSNPQYSIDQITENYYTISLDKLIVTTLTGNQVWVKIEKDVEVKKGVTKKVAKTYSYSYHSWRSKGKGAENLIRYCSPHEVHNKFHHKHVYKNNQQVTTKIEDDDWPHVSEFLDEIIENY